MRRKRDYTDYVRDILDAAQKAERFIAGVEFEAFQAKDEKVFVVIRALEIIGGTATHIPPALRARDPEVPCFIAHILPPAPLLSRLAPAAGSPAPGLRRWRPIAAPTSPLRGAH